MLDAKQFKQLVSDTLTAINLGGDTAINLVMGTCLQESGLHWLQQENGGVAVGIAQCEPATYHDICTRINMHVIQYKKILNYLNMPFFPADATALIGNMTLAIIICRLKYWLLSQPLPGNTVNELSAYYITYYNTSAGAATIEQATKNFQIAMDT